MPLDMRSASAWTWQRWHRERRWRARGRWRGEGERLEAPGAVPRAHNHLHQEDEDEDLGIPIDGGTQGSVEEAAEAERVCQPAAVVPHALRVVEVGARPM